MGYRGCKESKISKPELGHLQKAGAPALKKLREFKVKDASAYEAGQQLQVRGAALRLLCSAEIHLFSSGEMSL